MRYVSRPKMRQWDEYQEQALDVSLTVCDHEPIDTGLLDHRGDPIFRMPNAIGFGRDD